MRPCLRLSPWVEAGCRSWRGSVYFSWSGSEERSKKLKETVISCCLRFGSIFPCPFPRPYCFSICSKPRSFSSWCSMRGEAFKRHLSFGAVIFGF